MAFLLESLAPALLFGLVFMVFVVILLVLKIKTDQKHQNNPAPPGRGNRRAR